jgi:SAM-dependent methyltransferase
MSTHAQTTIDGLACPRDRSALEPRGERVVCAEGHDFPFPEGIPVLVDTGDEPTQPGYWSGEDEIARVLREEPAEVEGEGVDPYVAELIIGTHGNLYRDLAHGMTRYPIPHFPLPPGEGRTLLDIGCNWGRWSIAATRAGYDVIGIDPSIEAIVAARRIAKQLGADVRYVVADGRHLPFRDRSLDVVFSYGVLQHFSKEDVRRSLREIGRVVEPEGYTWVQMPNALGVRNVYQLARRRFREGNAFEVRYWTPRELRRAWTAAIGPSELTTDGFFTLNPQTADLDLLPARFRALVRVSETLRRASGRVPALTNLADSVNIRATPR